MHKRFKSLAGFALALLLVGAAVYWHLGRGEPVQTAQPIRGAAVEAVYATAVVEPLVLAKVAPLGPARLVAIHKRDGEPVAAQEALAQLDDREARGNLEQWHAQRDYRRQDLKRQEALVAQGFVSPATLDKVRAELRQAEAALAAARRPLAETVLRAPIGGVVLRQDGEIGEMVSAGQVLFWVGAPQPLRITADVDEEDILRLTPGQKALIKADGLPHQVIEGKVSEITEKGDPINKNYRVRISLPETTPLKTGMTVEVNIITRESADALLVPLASLKGKAIWTVQNGRAVLVPVETGVRGKEQVEILAGLAPDALLIVDPPSRLAAGARVRPR
ncbi:MAG: efflux RND transporter periplasmic adaptor subunit [Azovibrio sp.]|nr:efflux RND transporter periplasmic adaptor subunit [Azovibrio sp.]